MDNNSDESDMKINGMTEKEFYKKYKLEFDNEFRTTCPLKWEDFVQIYNDYIKHRHIFFKIEEFLHMEFQNAIRDGLISAHSIKSRTKDAEHLTAKLIRKKYDLYMADEYKKYHNETDNNYVLPHHDERYRNVDITNYTSVITDIVGIRVLLTYEEECKKVDTHIQGKYHALDMVKYSPINGEQGDGFAQLDIPMVKKNYRSIHYTIIIQSEQIPSVQESIQMPNHYSNLNHPYFAAEIQVRTIFQEGWCEVDHDNLYPYLLKNETLKIFSETFSKMAHLADEMANAFKELKKVQDK